MTSQVLYIHAIKEMPEIKLTSKQALVPEVEATRSSDDVEMMEERMRRALGLGGPSAQQTLTSKAAPARQADDGAATPGSARRKPDGVSGSSALTSVPSVLQQRVAELERQLATERQKHGEVHQLLQRTELATRTLETRCQHSALAQQEELDRARQATLAAQRALDDAVFERQQRTTARRSAKARSQEEASPAATSPAPVVLAAAELDGMSSPRPTPEPPTPKKRGRPRTRPLPEPKPVRWWTPSFRTRL